MPAAVELVRVQLPLLRPHVYAGGQERVRDVVLVRAQHDDGSEGWGECSALSTPGYTNETTARSWDLLVGELVPQWLRGGTVGSDAPMAYAALEEAALDLSLRADGVALVDWLASGLGPRRDAIEWCAVVGLVDTDTMLAEVGSAIAAGAKQVKVKITPEHDLEPLRRVRAQFPDIGLAADANGSYASLDVVPTELDALDLAYLEQPLAADDLAGMAALARDLSVPIALDESLTSADRIDDAAAAFDVAFVASVKVGRLGGLRATVQALEAARRHRIDAFVGGMLETAVGRAIALAVAAQAPCTRPTDAGPTARYFDADVGSAFGPDAVGALHAPTGAGIGLLPDPESIDRFCVDRVMITT